ncbi:MAG TPA: O-antigen ligase family protein [Candidatus Baltobacteraceae bacterium]
MASITPRSGGFDVRVALFVLAIASIPVWPAFISFAALTPPGVSLIPLPLAAVDLLLCAIAAAVAVCLLWRERAGASALLMPSLLYLATWILAALLGFDPLTGLLMAIAPALGIVFAASIAAWYARPGAALATYVTLLVTGTLVCVLGIVLDALHRPAALYALVHGRATATFVVPGEFAGYLLLLIAAAAGVALVTRSVRLRVLAIVTLTVALAALFLTYSRAGWLGAAVGGALFCYAMLVPPGSGRRRAALTGLGLGTALVVGIACIAVYEGHHNPSEDFARLSIWQAGIAAITLFPLTGVGPGAFRHVYPLLRPLSGEPFAFHVHNLLLTAFAETGAVGVAALLFLWWGFARALRTALRGALPAQRTFALALACGLVATWAQGTLDFVQIIVLGCWLPFMGLTLAAARSGLPE